ncbi:MAG: YdbH domain-containing protein [Desulfopila sp.]|jgi:hypothetical protein|nr:YdbH domain-containing protein [Desulfopila sp.]
MKKKLCILCCVAAAVMLSSGLFLYLLPLAAEHAFIALAAPKIPFSHKEFEVSRISPWRLDGIFFLGREGENSLRIPRFELNYSPGGLMRGKIDSLLIDSAVVYLEQHEGKVQLRGIQRKNRPAAEQAGFVLPPLPVTVEKILLRNCRIVYQGPGNSYSTDVDSELLLSYQENESSRALLQAVEGHVAVRGNSALELDFSVEETETGYKAIFDAAAAELKEAVTRLFPAKDFETDGRGRLQLQLETEGLTKLSHYSAVFEVESFNLQRDDVVLGSSNGDNPVVLKAQGNLQEGEFHLEGLQLVRPEPCGFEIDGRYSLVDNNSIGMLRIVPASTAAAIVLEYQARFGRETEIDYQLQGEPFILGDDLAVEKGFSGHGSVHLLRDSFTAVLIGAVPRIDVKKRGVVLEDVSFEMPLQYPQPPLGVVVPGNLFVGKISYQDLDIATLKASLQLFPEKVLLNAELRSPLYEELLLRCSASAAGVRDLRLDCVMPEVIVDSAALPPKVSFPEELSAKGSIAAEGHFFVSGSRVSGKVQIEYSDMSVAYKTTLMEDISGKLVFDDLPALRSRPGQRLDIGKLEFGRIRMSDAEVYFRVDAADSIFIEKVKLNWCGGRVETAGVTVNRTMKNLDATLYCDRLRYVELLDQLGIGDAEGDGSLNGRLPVTISRQGIEFDNGFLFSTPGNSGIVRFRNTAQFRRGMAAMESSPYIDYSMDALENFSYNWTKLTFNTEKSELVLSLQLDGKPEKPLAYAFEGGKIVASSKGRGLQHPIRLDVNFRLPLTELFRYGKNIQSIMENM